MMSPANDIEAMRSELEHLREENGAIRERDLALQERYQVEMREARRKVAVLEGRPIYDGHADFGGGVIGRRSSVWQTVMCAILAAVVLAAVVLVGGHTVTQGSSDNQIVETAKFHQEKATYHRKQAEMHMRLERHHSSSFYKVHTELNPNGTLVNPNMPLEDWCQAALHPQQARYYLWRVHQFDASGAHREDLMSSLSALLYELVFRMAADTGQVEKCNVINAGAGGDAAPLVKISEALEPLHCRTLAYETDGRSVRGTRDALRRFPSAKVRKAGFADVKAEFSGQSTRYTTLDQEILSNLGRGHTERDVLIVRLDALAVGQLWRRQGGDAKVSPELRAAKGLEQSLLSRRVTALVWNGRTGSSLREEVNFVAAFGYRVYYLGTEKILRVDGGYWDPAFTGQGGGGEGEGEEDRLFGEPCHVPVTLLALVEGHSFHAHAMKQLQVCVPKEGGACFCDAPGDKEAVGQCRRGDAPPQPEIVGDGDNTT